MKIIWLILIIHYSVSYGSLFSIDKEINKIQEKLNLLNEINFEFHIHPTNVTDINKIEKLLDKKLMKIIKIKKKQSKKLKNDIIIQKVFIKSLKNIRGDLLYLDYIINQNSYYSYFISKNKLIFIFNKTNKDYTYNANNDIIKSMFYKELDNIIAILIDKNLNVIKLKINFDINSVNFNLVEEYNINTLDFKNINNLKINTMGNLYSIIDSNIYYEYNLYSKNLIKKVKLKNKFKIIKNLINNIYIVLYDDNKLCLFKEDFEFNNCYEEKDILDYEVRDKSVIILTIKNELILLNFTKDSYFIENKCNLTSKIKINKIKLMNEKIILYNNNDISYWLFKKLQTCKLNINSNFIKLNNRKSPKQYFLTSDNRIGINIKLKNKNKIVFYNLKYNSYHENNDYYFELFNKLKIPIIIITVLSVLYFTKGNNKKVKTN